MRILSDIHGDFSKIPSGNVIQIGDLGIYKESDLSKLPSNIRFFAGNHDNYKAMQKHPGFLGRYGYIMPEIFFISGAESIDKNYRIPGVSWWDYEELSYKEGYNCLEAYHGCEVLLSHDCGQSLVEHFYIKQRSFTRVLIDEIIKKSKPKIHIFGHHHLNYNITINGVEYQCLNINESMDI